jgi:LysM repeat protein
MALVEELSTGTAMAELAAAMTAGTPAASAATATPNANVSATATSSETTPVASATPTLALVTPAATEPLPTTTTNRPASYTLQKGEFPYCIARRFNIDPGELLNLNGLTSGDIYYPNLTLKIPQSGNPFPGTRALRPHPDTYTVADASLTLYGVACVYGDVDPAAIAQANNLQLSAALTVGQKLTIP